MLILKMAIGILALGVACRMEIPKDSRVEPRESNAESSRDSEGHSSDSTPDSVDDSLGTVDSNGDSYRDSSGHSDSNPDTGDGGDWVTIRAAVDYACGLHADGTLSCWGKNNLGQATPPTGVFVGTAATSGTACGIQESGEILCWGNVGAGDEVLNAPSGSWFEIRCSTVDCVVLNAAGNLGWWGVGFGDLPPPAGVYISADVSDNICAVEFTGRLVCWETDGSEWEPLVGTFVSVAVGPLFGCALDALGAASCWSTNDWASDWGVDQPPSEQWAFMDFEADHGCGLTWTGDAVCWGYPYLWAGSDSTVAPPGVFTDITAGSLYSCGVTEDGQALCWGKNDVGQATPL